MDTSFNVRNSMRILLKENIEVIQFSSVQSLSPVFLPGKFHGQRSLVGYSPWGRKECDMTEWLHFHFSLSCIGEGNGNLLQYSCLEDPRDRGAWWAAVYGVAQSRARLKQLSFGLSLSSSVVSDSLRPHESQPARPPCPSLTPGVHPNSCPSSQWCHPHLIFCLPLLLLPSIFPSIRIFSNE